jgi:hypothetical protein
MRGDASEPLEDVDKYGDSRAIRARFSGHMQLTAFLGFMRDLAHYIHKLFPHRSPAFPTNSWAARVDVWIIKSSAATRSGSVEFSDATPTVIAKKWILFPRGDLLGLPIGFFLFLLHFRSQPSHLGNSRRR